MLSDLLARIRPRDSTAASLADALAAAERELAAAEVQVSHAGAERTRALLDAPTLLAGAEAALAEAEANRVRLAAARDELRGRKAAADKAEARTAAEAMRAALETEAQACTDALAREYPVHARAIAALLAREAAIVKRLHTFTTREALALRASGALPPDARAVCTPADRVWRAAFSPPVNLCDRVVLPPLTGLGGLSDEHAAFWLPAYSGSGA